MQQSMHRRLSYQKQNKKQNLTVQENYPIMHLKIIWVDFSGLCHLFATQLSDDNCVAFFVFLVKLERDSFFPRKETATNKMFKESI